MQELAELLTNRQNVAMQTEIILMLLLFLLPLYKLKKTKGVIVTWTLMFAAFLYLHQTLVAFVVAGFYMVAIFFLLYPTVMSFVPGRKKERLRYLSPALSITGGYGLWIVFCALISILGIAGKGAVYLFALALIWIAWYLRVFRPHRGGGLGERLNTKPDKKLLFIVGIILIALLIQLNRINIAIDYDSLHYGLRSEYILAEGRWGIFEDHGLVNTVYTYPKGFEILTIGLSFLPSYSFILCANVYILILILIVAGKTVGLVVKDRYAALFASMVLSLIPGISNMALTAKSDLFTLLLQLLAVYLVTRAVKEGGARELMVVSLTELMLSLTGKPTAAVFSTGLFIVTLLFLIKEKNKLKNISSERRDRQISSADSRTVLIIGAVAFLIICLRTFLLTGLPITSVFSGLFTRLGFEIKYPFSAQSIPSEGISLGLIEGIKNTAVRILKFLFFPGGEDMSHVIMAWGGIFFAALLLVFILEAKKTRSYLAEKHETEALMGFKYLSAASVTMLLLAVISLHLLWQVDGNYFMLMYCLISMVAVVCIYCADKKREEAESSRWLHDKLRNAAVMFITLSMIMITAHTGWAGAVGFTPIKIFNRGLVEHEDIIEDIREQTGSDEIWRELNEACSDSGKRIIAFEKDPFCYSFLSAVESYTDIEGSGGNVYLVKKLNIFKEYLAAAEIDYIYVDASYLLEEGRDRAKSLVRDLIEDGTLVDLRFNEELSADKVEEKCAEIEEKKLTKLYGRIDKDRVKERWEIPLTKEKLESAEDELKLFESALDAANKDE